MRIWALMLLALMSTQTIAQQNTPPPAPCSAAEYRQFDFWIGDWQVFSSFEESKQVGDNRIEAVLGGCVLAEHWTGAGGNGGQSFNSYDPVAKQWVQHWVDGFGGEPLQLRGRFENGAMVLSGKQFNPKTRKSQWQRITWTPRADGVVRQQWEQSDNGKQWATAFDGLYKRRVTPPAPADVSNEHTIKQLLTHYASGCVKNSVWPMVDLFHSTIVDVDVDGRITEGKAALHQVYAKRLNGDLKGIQCEIKPIQIITQANGQILSIVDLIASLPGQTPQTIRVHLQWIATDTGWKIIHQVAQVAVAR